MASVPPVLTWGWGTLCCCQISDDQVGLPLSFWCSASQKHGPVVPTSQHNPFLFFSFTSKQEQARKCALNCVPGEVLGGTVAESSLTSTDLEGLVGSCPIWTQSGTEESRPVVSLGHLPLCSGTLPWLLRRG